MALFIITYWASILYLRVRAEEQMLLKALADKYRAYMQKTGAVIPRF